MKKYLTILILFFSFTASAQIIYTPMSAGGYQMKYLKVDSGFALPFRDTTIGRGVNRPGLMAINTVDSLPYYYNGRYWKPVYVDSSGVIELINGKIDSVTVNGNNIFYWVAGLGYGAQLNKLDSIHVSTDSIFTCIAGNCTFQYLTTAGTGTVTSIMAGFGLTGDTITTTGTIVVDTSVFHTSNWNNATYAPIVHFHSASDIISGTLPIARGGTGLSGIGGAGQSLRVATSGSSLEYYTPPDVSGKINYTDSNTVYVTPTQLATKVDTSYKDTVKVAYPLWAFSSDSLGIRTDSLPKLEYAATGRDTSTWDNQTLIDKQFLRDRISTVTATGITRTELQDTAAAIRAGFPTGGVWGSITGTLSDQTDLQTALNTKQNALTLTTTGTSGAATLTGATLNIPTPSIPTQFNPIAGTGITLSGTYPNITFNASGGTIAGLYQKLTATAGQTAFTFTLIPTDANKVGFYINGSFVSQSFYSVSGNTITFTSGLQLNDVVEEQGVQ